MSRPPVGEPQKILVIETLYLGDLIHTLPLLQALRPRYPAAQLDVLVRAPHVPLMAQVAGIGSVLAMEPKTHKSLSGLRTLCRELSARQYDLVLNPGASDRAAWLTAFSGGAHRLGRVNRRGQGWLARRQHDAVIQRDWGAEPMFWQKLTAFAPTLGLTDTVRFGLDFSGVDVSALALPARYVHLSPFASEDVRSLPPATLVALAAGLRQRLPDCGLVVSCGPSPRERQRLAVAADALSALGVTLLAGRASLPELGAVIQRAAVHVGPDSGPLHLAAALARPTVACFLYKAASAEWMPLGAQHRCFGVSTRHEGGLYGLPVAEIIDAAAALST